MADLRPTVRRQHRYPCWSRIPRCDRTRRSRAALRSVTRAGARSHPDGCRTKRAGPAMTAAGWPWTVDAHGWTEPTAWGYLALRLLRPSESARVADALSMFAERECVGGGWNYGSRTTLGVNLHPYVQTTALALLALGGSAPELTTRGVVGLRKRGAPRRPATSRSRRRAVRFERSSRRMRSRRNARTMYGRTWARRTTSSSPGKHSP